MKAFIRHTGTSTRMGAAQDIHALRSFFGNLTMPLFLKGVNGYK